MTRPVYAKILDSSLFVLYIAHTATAFLRLASPWVMMRVGHPRSVLGIMQQLQPKPLELTVPEGAGGFRPGPAGPNDPPSSWAAVQIEANEPLSCNPGLLVKTLAVTTGH